MRSSLPIWQVGIDGGTSGATAYGSRAGSTSINRCSIPSIVGTGNMSKLLTIRRAKTITKALKMDEYVVRREGESDDQFIGKLAERECLAFSFAKGDPSRYWNDHLSLLTDALLGTIVTDDVAEVHVVPGLPISLYNDANIEKVIKNLEGPHKYEINGIHKEFRIIVPTVAMEGIGALTADDIPPSIEEDLLMAFFDIGERTIDIGAADSELTPVYKKCRGKELGVGMIVQAIRDEIVEKYQRLLPVTTVHAILKKYSEKKLTSIKVEDRSISPDVIKAIIDHQVELIGKAMMTFIAETWNEEGASVGSDMSIIALIGGGAHLFRHFFEARFPQLYVPAEPEYSNARSYHEVAQEISEEAA